MVRLTLMTDDKAVGEEVMELLLPVLRDAVALTVGEPTRLTHRGSGFRAVLDVRPATADERLLTLVRVRREQHLGSLLFAVGDEVELKVRQSGYWIHEGLEDEGEDARMHYDLPAGTRGRVVHVRDYPSPYPYVVIWEVHGHPEIGVAQHDLRRAPARRKGGE
ncbi:hypothetical protein ACWCXH_33675 [Kitasatospora sp. NPDC001660]